MSLEQQVKAHLEFVYGADVAGPLFERLRAHLTEFQQQHPALAKPIAPSERVTEQDAILITYGDQIQEPDKPTLLSLAEWLDRHLRGLVNTVHILPFYPYSSDDGFSVIDYKAVHADMGDWPDVRRLGQHFRLMFDAVINHISSQSAWFQGFLKDDPKYMNYFITMDPSTDLSMVTRPRALPLLTPVETPSGVKHVWSTFSADQLDINYENPDVLMEIIDVLLFYVTQGAEFIRLDAIGFMWKELGTTCIHLPQVHRLIQLFRTVLDIVAPQVVLITETNVPHKENISYFGDGKSEAQMVYNFTLAPLVLHTFRSKDASVLQTWADELEELPETATFFNFIASHDGIGVRPAEGILTKEEVQALADQTLAHGGRVSFKTNPDGSQSPYELNVTLFDALSDPNSNEPESRKVDRFIASQAIMLALVGVPGIYVHSLVGSANNLDGLAETGRARTINREKWQRIEIDRALATLNTRATRVFSRYAQLLRARRGQAAFHPNGKQVIVMGHPGVFALLRTSPDGSNRVLCLHNITDQPLTFEVDVNKWTLQGTWRSLFSEDDVEVDADTLYLPLEPYAVRWLAQ